MIWKNWGDYEIFRVFGFGDFDGGFDCCYNKLREIMKILSVLCLLALWHRRVTTCAVVSGRR